MKNLLPVTLRSATLVLAYTHYSTSKFMPGRCFTGTDLRRLAAWIGRPQPRLRSLRQHQMLAAHVALLQASGLLAHNDQHWYVQPAVYEWLSQPAAARIALFLEAFAACRYPMAVTDLNLTAALPLDYNAYLHQQLTRQADLAPPADDAAAAWQAMSEREWQLCLPPTWSGSRLFHLLQLGPRTPDGALSLTPLSIGRAARRGYSFIRMESLLQQALGRPLHPDQRLQLQHWLQRQDAYQLRPVYLLSTKQPRQASAVLQNDRLRRRVQAQIGPRHLIVSPDIQPSLQKWAARRDYLLDAPTPATDPVPFSPSVYQWLGLRLLQDLGQLIPLPCPPPAAALEALTAHLDPAQESYLQALANQILTGLQEVISGRDAFFPAEQPPPPELITRIETALAEATPLTFTYCTLHAREPKQHTVEPLRLEQRGELYYLDAYSYRAAANLTFRLDRIVTLVA